MNDRSNSTILTPHIGEFKRLFPEITDIDDRLTAVQTAAEKSSAIILLKGAKTAIANSQGLIWLIPESTPALARGGSGDILTGLTAGLATQCTKTQNSSLFDAVATAAWWHAQAGIKAAKDHTELGVDATTLAQYLTPTINELFVN